MKKKTNIFFLFITLLIINIGIVFAATTDTKAPTVTKLTFDKTENLKPGDKVYLNTDMKDDVSGIETTYIWVNRLIINNGTYNDNFEEVSQALQVLYDGNKPYVIIPDSYITGSYYVREIDMFDKEDNRSYFYSADQMQYFKERYEYEKADSAYISAQNSTFDEWLDSMTRNFEPARTTISVKFTVDAGAPDTESPFLAATKLSSEKIKYNESVTLELKVSEDAHKMRVNVGFSNGAESATYFDDTDSSILRLNFTPAMHKVTGIVYVDYVILEDYSGNMAFYLRDGYKGDLAVDYYQNTCQVCEKLQEIKFEVEDAVIDNTPPVLKNVKIDKNKYPIPSFAKIELEATDETALASEANVTFKSGNKELTAILYLEDDGIYRGELDINQYAELGKYELTDVVISDAASNGLIYSNYDHKYKDKDLTIKLGFELTSKFKADVTTSTIASDLLEKINNAKNSDNIAIDATGNQIIKKEVFDAIKGTNKTIFVEANGIEWIFNGKDIKETKDIDVSLEVFYDYNYKDLDTDKYEGKALILKFAPNGVLPTTATVRVKLDYTLRSYIGEEVYVYYYDKESDSNKVFSDIVGNVLSLNDNGWFEFNINHNSAYIFTNTKPAAEYIKEDKELIEENKKEEPKEDTPIKPVEKKDNKLTIIIIVIVAILVLGLIGGLITFLVIKNKKKNTVQPNSVVTQPVQEQVIEPTPTVVPENTPVVENQPTEPEQK